MILILFRVRKHKPILINKKSTMNFQLFMKSVFGLGQFEHITQMIKILTYQEANTSIFFFRRAPKTSSSRTSTTKTSTFKTSTV